MSYITGSEIGNLLGSVTSPVAGDLAVTGNLAVTGTETSAGAAYSGNITPDTNDNAALGTTTLMWSDLFLASGGVINWNNGDVTVTHSANTLAFAGASSGYTYDAVVKPSANDAAALGAATVSWSDLFLASGAVLNFNNGNVTITHGAGALTCAGITAFSFGAGVTLNVTGTRIVQSYHTDITSTNAVTVDSSETVKSEIAPYEGDAVALIRGMDVITYKHDEWLDPSGSRKLGVRAESVHEPLAVTTIERDQGSYPGVNVMGLLAMTLKAVQQLANEIAELKK